MFHLYDSIRTKATELGLCIFGITDILQPKHFPQFENWLDRKQFGDMSYLENPKSRELRKNPYLLMPKAKSIVIIGLPYSYLNFSINNFYGKIASFAQQPDYHSVIRNKLNQLLGYIKQISENEVEGSIFCDSIPLLEKELAQRAGLGWIGKNSLLISSQFGSFMNLGELFLNLELPHPSIKNEDSCSNCHLCVDACPTQCIQPDRTIEAQKCISYLTIEHKGIIDQSLRTKMNSWIFGCDICQIVCPWNKSKILQNEISEKPYFYQKIRDKGFSNEQFDLIFENTPLKRIKRRGFLRNYAIALGNSCSSEAIPDLEFLFSEEDPVLRIYVTWAIGKIGDPQSKNILEQHLIIEKNPDVLAEINNTLGTLN